MRAESDLYPIINILYVSQVWAANKHTYTDKQTDCETVMGGQKERDPTKERQCEQRAIYIQLLIFFMYHKLGQQTNTHTQTNRQTAKRSWVERKGSNEGETMRAESDLYPIINILYVSQVGAANNRAG